MTKLQNGDIFFFETVSHYVAQAGPKLPILHLQNSPSWSPIQGSPDSTSLVLGSLVCTIIHGLWYLFWEINVFTFHEVYFFLPKAVWGEGELHAQISSFPV
jgi:hypothetical protein